MSGTNFFDFREQIEKRRNRPVATNRVPGLSAANELLSVSQLTHLIDTAIQGGLPGTVVVHGELSNVNLHRGSGHLYFTLKDETACIECVMWKSDHARLKFEVSDGHEVLVSGSVKVYAEKGRYQLYARKIEPMGKGALELAFRQLHAKLEKEGLFAPDRKRPLPAYPLRISMVTSREGAALQDMLKVLRRFSFLRLKLFHVPVQGEGAGERIAHALNAAARQAEVILLARGGGSLEDLWAFNDEIVARAIAVCAVPVVTGIGHEVDTTIADLVADYHAHTPTEAAQVVTTNWRAAAAVVENLSIRLRRGLAAVIGDARQRFASVERQEFFRRPVERINQHRQRLDDRQRSMQLAMGGCLRRLRRAIDEKEQRLARHHPAASIARLRERLADADLLLLRAQQAVVRRVAERLTMLSSSLLERHPQHAVRLHRQHIEQLAQRLAALSPEAVLRRGYSITRLKKGGAVVRAAGDVREGDRLITRVAEGEIESIVRDSKQSELFE